MLILNLAAFFPTFVLLAFLLFGFFGMFAAAIITSAYRVSQGMWGNFLPWRHYLRPWVIAIFLLSCLFAFGGSYLLYVRTATPAPAAWFSRLPQAEKKTAIKDIQQYPGHNMSIQQFMALRRQVEDQKAETAAKIRMEAIVKSLKGS
jgi:energy-coupling factor transporter transmembrane protein EcfT